VRDERLARRAQLTDVESRRELVGATHHGEVRLRPTRVDELRIELEVGLRNAVHGCPTIVSRQPARLCGVDAGPIEGIDAVTLHVADMARSVAFYRALGFELEVGGPEAAFTTFRAGRSCLTLPLDPQRAPTGVWGRVIFFVDDVDAMHARVVDAGATPDGSPTDAPWGERYFHAHDPDGHELSFARPLRA
jgi:catechol 2,3-dioxygenase-like lactoylglutathione lyase family enzyme